MTTPDEPSTSSGQEAGQEVVIDPNINDDPPLLIEPTTESAVDPDTPVGPLMQVFNVTPTGVPSAEYIPLNELPPSMLIELVYSGNDAAAQELDWRMKNQAAPDSSDTAEAR